MHLLDTVTISEFRKAERKRSDPFFERWARSIGRESMWPSVITVQELTTGYLRKSQEDPPQARSLEAWVDTTVLPFAQRILDVDLRVAKACAAMHVPRTLPYRDSLIAATARVHRLAVVMTRNVHDFEGLGIDVLNPFVD